MFKYVIVVLALIAAAFAAPKPILLAAPASYSYSERFDRPAAATTFYSLPYAGYQTAYQAPLAYPAAYPAAYAYL
uniref:Uncharacterized protein n=1 Tax=Aedes aegypti TaxID=7159 RepID=A0A903VUG5_AEDAE